MTVVAGSTLDLNDTTITGGSLTNAGTVDVTGGSTSTLDGVSVTNTGGTVTGTLALDGNGFSSRSFESTTSASVTLTTSNANDVIILEIVQNGTTVSSVSDTDGLTWYQRAVAGSGSQTIYEYYAIAPNALSADAITVDFSGTASYADLNAFGISGANTSSPFDTSVPTNAATSTGAVTTSNANDFIFAAYRFSTDATPSAGSSWTAINASGGYYLSEYQITSSTQAGLVATASTTDENGGIVDAVQAAPSTTTTAATVTVDAGSTLDLNGTTMGGGTLSNAGTVAVTGGSTSTLNGVSVTNTGATMAVGAGSTPDLNGTSVTDADGDVMVGAGSTLNLSNATIAAGALSNSGTVNSSGISAFTGVAVTNSGVLDAMTSGTLTMDPGSVTNTGTLEATAGGALDLNGISVNNAGGTVNVDAASTLNLSSTTMSGGTLSNAGTVTVTGGSTSTLNGVGVTDTGGTGTVTGTLALDGNGFSSRPFESTTSTSIALTTLKANDVIILEIVQNGTTVSSVSDTDGLTWHQRAVAGSDRDHL